MSGVHMIIAADDGSLPAKTELEKKQMLAQRREVEMHSYYDSIAQHTYETKFVPLTIDQTEALRKYFRGADDITNNEHFQTLKSDIADCLKQFQTKDNSDEKSEESKQDTNETSQFFVRLSTRSPKDAVDKPPFRKKLIALLNERFGGDNSELYLDYNQRLIGLRECFSKAMACENADEILTLLCYSERCVSDIRRLLENKHLLPKWDLYLVIRKFDFIPIAHEFRCFVYKKQLTAATQYFPNCYFPQLCENKAQIWKKINDFYESVSDTIKVESCILDLVVDLQSDKVTIIELNPFGRTTGPGFFDWVKDKSLLEGCDDVQLESPLDRIRVRTEVYKHAKAVLSQWAQVWIEYEAQTNAVTVGDDSSANGADTTEAVDHGRKFCSVL